MTFDVLAPPVGTNVASIVIVTWYKQPGDAVQKGEPLFSVETDKATLDIEAPASGILQHVSASPGDEVATLSRIAVIDDGRAPNTDTPVEQVVSSAPAVPLSTLPTPPSSPAASRTFISPRAKQLALQENIEWETLRGSGPQGAIVERDVRAFLQTSRGPGLTPLAERMVEATRIDATRIQGTGIGGRVTRGDVARAVASSTAPNEILETLPLKGTRAVIAERMLASRTQTASVTLSAEADATALVALRADLRQDGIPVSYNDLFLYILARALREYPRLNASLQGDEIRVFKSIHIGLAVDTERGLVVPVVREVERQGLEDIARETTRLISMAKQNKLTPDELRGGTFTLTNLGVYGIDVFTPIINLPETAILGVGRIAPQPAVVDGQVIAQSRVWLSLTFDHRIIDGAPAARFVQLVVQLVEKPHLLLA